MSLENVVITLKKQEHLHQRTKPVLSLFITGFNKPFATHCNESIQRRFTTFSINDIRTIYLPTEQYKDRFMEEFPNYQGNFFIFEDNA